MVQVKISRPINHLENVSKAENNDPGCMEKMDNVQY